MCSVVTLSAWGHHGRSIWLMVIKAQMHLLSTDFSLFSYFSCSTNCSARSGTRRKIEIRIRIRIQPTFNTLASVSKKNANIDKAERCTETDYKKRRKCIIAMRLDR